jgi:hypothetical protein
MSDPITAPVPKFAREIAGVSESTAWQWIKDGKIETVAIGARRLVVVESYRRLVAQKLEEPPADARRNSAVPSFGSTVAREATPPEASPKRRGRPRKIAQIAPSP